MILKFSYPRVNTIQVLGPPVENKMQEMELSDVKMWVGIVYQRERVVDSKLILKIWSWRKQRRSSSVEENEILIESETDFPTERHCPNFTAHSLLRNLKIKHLPQNIIEKNVLNQGEPANSCKIKLVRVFLLSNKSCT